MANTPPTTRSFAELTQKLNERANIKRAAVAAAPEKDPAEKGNVTIPKDPQTAPGAMNLPANGTNVDATKPTTVAPAKTIVGEEKPKSANTNLSEKAAALTSALRNLRTKAATAAEISTNGSLPSDAKNDNKNTTPTEPATEHKNQAGNPDANAKTAAPATPVDATQKPAPTPPVDSKGELPKAKVENTDDPKTKEKEKMASDAEVFGGPIDPAFAIKIASVILSTEEGRAFTQAELEKAAGAEQAEDIIRAAMFMEKQAAALLDEEEAGILAAQEFWAKATPEERAHIEKVASVHDAALATLTEDFEKLAYNQGAQAAAGMADEGMMGDQMPPGQDGSQISDQDIAQVLEQLIQSGEIDEKTAMDIMQALQGGGAPDAGGGGAGGAPGGGMPPGMGGGAPDAGGAPGGPQAGTGPGAPEDAGGPPEKPKKAPKDDGQEKDASVAGLIKFSSAQAARLVDEAIAAATPKSA